MASNAKSGVNKPVLWKQTKTLFWSRKLKISKKGMEVQALNSTAPDSVYVSYGIVDLLAELPLIRLNLDTCKLSRERHDTKSIKVQQYSYL